MTVKKTLLTLLLTGFGLWAQTPSFAPLPSIASPGGLGTNSDQALKEALSRALAGGTNAAAPGTAANPAKAPVGTDQSAPPPNALLPPATPSARIVKKSSSGRCTAPSQAARMRWPLVGSLSTPSKVPLARTRPRLPRSCGTRRVHCRRTDLIASLRPAVEARRMRRHPGFRWRPVRPPTPLLFRREP